MSDHAAKIVTTAEGGSLEADASLENEPGFLFDALVLPDGDEGVKALASDAHTMEFIMDQYRHCKTILVLGAAKALLEKAGLSATLSNGKPDAGLIIAASGSTVEAAKAFIRGVAHHRHVERETDLPRV